MQNIANNLLLLRKELNLLQSELASELGVSPATLSKWEHGSSVPTTNDLISIHYYFGISLDDLVLTDLRKQILFKQNIFAKRKPYKSFSKQLQSNKINESYERLIFQRLTAISYKLDQLLS